MTLAQIANSFAVQPEATSTYPWLAAPNLDVGIPEFITSVYQNLFERNPDAAGLAFWTQELLNGKPPGQFILDVISGATGDDKLVIDHKKEVGNYYADQALLKGLDWNVTDDLAGAADVMDGDRAFWVSAGSVAAGKASADAIIQDQLGGPHNFIELTTGIDNIHVGANQTVLGNDLTFNPGDRIEGSSGTVTLNYGAAAGPFFGTLNNLDLVNLTTTGPTVQVATNWTNIDVIDVKQSTGALVLQDLQASSNDAPPGQTFTNYGLHDFVTGNTVTFNFDVQAVDGANTIVNLAVAEVTGGILMNSIAGQSIETVNLQIQDTPGFASKIASFSAQGIQTLGISGGAAGLNFQIVAPLDAGLKVIDASKALSNLTLDVSNSTQAMNITLGSGNDKLITGDTLNPLPGFDTINGGAGTDEVTAVFTTAGTRNPHMTNVEIATLTFNANATMSFLDVDGLNTINVLSSTNRISLHDMDSTVTTINVTGLQAPQGTGAAPIGVGRHEIYYDPTGFQTGGNNLTLNWTSDVAEDPHAGEIYFRSIRNVEFNHSGPFDTRFFDTIPDGDDAVFQFDDTLRSLVMNNKGTGDLYLLGGAGFEAIAGTRFMTDLSLNATGGDFAISGDIDTIRDLRHLTMTASGGNYLALDDVGSAVDAVNGGSGFGQMLETVDITTGSNSTVSFDELHAELSTISTFNVTVGNDGEVSINDIWAQDISDMTVIVNEEGLFDPTFHFTNQGDNLTVKGAGFINPFIFTNEAFANMNFSGLTVDNVVIDFDNAKIGSTLIATKFNDVIDASQGADNITSGLGDDDVDGNGGNDIIVDAGGNNDIRGDRGADSITLQSATGLDRIIVGFEGPADSDTVVGFSINNDRVVLDVSDMQAGPINFIRTGDGTTWQSQTPIAPGNIDIQTVNGATTVLGQTDILSIAGTFADRASLEQAIEVGGSRQITNVGANFNNDDAYVIQWTDTGGNAHISTARIIDEFPAGGANVTYNFDVQDMVVLTGVPVINQLNFEAIG